MTDIVELNKAATLSDVIASQRLSKTSLPLLMRYVAIPIAWPLTVVAARMGLSPNGVTAIRAAILLAGSVCVAQPSALPLFVGLALYAVVVVLDSVDGNLCRLHDRASYFGKFFDGAVDMLTDLILPLALAVHLWRSGAAEPVVLLVGAIAVFSLAVIFLLVHRVPLFEATLRESSGNGGKSPSPSPHPRLADFLNKGATGRVIQYLDGPALNTLFDLRYAALIACLAVDRLTLFLWLLAGTYAFVMTLFTGVRMARAYAALDVHRRSKSAA